MDHYLENTLRQLRRIYREPTIQPPIVEQPGFDQESSISTTSSTMWDEDPRALQDYRRPEDFELKSEICSPKTPANFEFSLPLIRKIKQEPYGDITHECALKNLANFSEFSATVKENNVTQEFLRLKLFHFCLCGQGQEIVAIHFGRLINYLGTS